MRLRREFICAVAAASAAVIGLVSPASAAPFQSDGVVVYRVGTGTAAVGNVATEVFLDEYSPSGALRQSVALPTAAAGANQALTANGDSTSEGMLNRSADGQYLVLTGYAAAPGAAAPSSSTSIGRVVGRVDAAGGIDTSTLINYAFGGDNIRSVASPNGTDLYVGGTAASSSTGGVFYTTLGSATGVNISTTAVRNVGVYGGQLFAGSTSSSAPSSVFSLGTGLPTSAAAPAAVPGLPAASDPSTNQFVFLDLSSAVTGVDTLYVADDKGTALTKYSLVGGTWTKNGSIGGGSDDYNGLTASVAGSDVSLFATRLRGNNADQLVRLIDPSGYNGAFSGLTVEVLATAASNEVFRGVALSPTAVPEPTGLGLLAVAGMAMVRRGRRRFA